MLSQNITPTTYPHLYKYTDMVVKRTFGKSCTLIMYGFLVRETEYGVTTAEAALAELSNEDLGRLVDGKTCEILEMLSASKGVQYAYEIVSRCLMSWRSLSKVCYSHEKPTRTCTTQSL